MIVIFRKVYYLSILFLFPYFLWSCEDESGPLPVQFEFRLLNAHGKISTSFNSGENFTISFLIINNSDELVNLIGFDTDDFLKVFMLTPSEGEILIGKPYTAIYCEYRTSYPISPKDTLRLERLWVTADSLKTKRNFNNSIICGYGDNVPLSTGFYFTRFKTTFLFSINGEQYSTPEQKFEINFSINKQ